MSPSHIPPHLVTFLASPQTPNDAAVDALEEWILHRRSKGDTLFEVSVGLAELEDKTPPHVSLVFDRARYVTNVPQPSDLTPPMGPFPLARSASPATILHHLLSQPMPTIEHSREVMLEFCLAREQKHREKKPGRGGKGTLGRDGFEDVGQKLGEVEQGLRMANDDQTYRSPYPSPLSVDHELDEPRKVGLMLVLALRMSLSYFTLRELADQLLLLGVADAERTLVQHIRRRIQGEGRYGVGKELEYVETLTLHLRPALGPAFRSAKTRTTLPPQPYYPVQLPAPSKSNIVKLISSFVKESDEGRTPSAFAANQAVASSSSPAADRGYFKRSTYSPSTPGGIGGSPKTPLGALPPPLHSPGFAPSIDGNSLANYAQELLSEYLTREKREYMLKTKWAKSGREQLGKDLGEIESALCLASKASESAHAPILLPVFLVLRRTFALPPCPLPSHIIEPYLDILSAPPDPDEVPFREPTVQTTTAALYVNPRLDDHAATIILRELVESERERATGAGASPEDVLQWLTGQISSVEKRFPDGSYAGAFREVRLYVYDAPRRRESQTSGPGDAPRPPAHRRALSTAVLPNRPSPANLITPRRQHSRSASMPLRQSSAHSSTQSSVNSSDGSIGEAPEPRRMLIDIGNPQSTATELSSHKTLPMLDMLSPTQLTDDSMSTAEPTSGWWDVVSAVEPGKVPLAPWQAAPMEKNSSITSTSELPLPPGAEPAQVIDYAGMDKLHLRSQSPSRPSGLPTPSRQVTSSVPTQTVDTPPRGIAADAEFSPRIKRLSPSLNPASSPPTPPLPTLSTSSGQLTHGHKSRLFSRSMTLRKSKDKENEKGNGKKDGDQKPANNPGRWNRDMVANIMGPPASKP